jgi:GntR family transcriptional regulator
MDNNFYEKYPMIKIKGLPKYAQLREMLRTAIEGGFWEPGVKLPAETDIARTTSFSLGTVQRALNALVEEGILDRLQGKGTFVREKSKKMDTPWHCRFAGNEEGSFLPVYPKVIVRKRITANKPWTSLINPNNSNIIQIDRTLNIGNEFIVYGKLFLNGDKFGAFLEKPLEEFEHVNFKNILSQEFNIPITRMSFSLRMMHFPDDICRVIKVKKNTLGILDKILASSDKKNPIYYQELYIPPNDRDLYISDSADIPEYWT